jgi:hypothetical protein
MSVFQIIFILLISYYLVKTVGKYFYNVIFHTEVHEQRSKQRTSGFENAFKNRKDDSDLKVDYVPNDQNSRFGNYKGGDYVDYEEV